MSIREEIIELLNTDAAQSSQRAMMQRACLDHANTIRDLGNALRKIDALAAENARLRALVERGAELYVRKESLCADFLESCREEMEKWK